MNGSKPSLGIVYDELCLKHLQDADHPESPRRLLAIQNALDQAGLLKRALAIPCRRATDEDLNLVHRAEYIEKVKSICRNAPAQLGPDVFISTPESLDAALLSAGGGFEAVDAIMNQKVTRVFCNTRPPGHHALPNQAMGFCVFNNIALCARYAQTRHKLNKILIVDWDVHHGNGTQDIFYEDPDVFYFSSHRFPFYPGTGARIETGEWPGKGSTLNVPFPPESGDEEYLGSYKRLLLPAALEFKPDLILISCGFDAHGRDPLGGMNLTEKAYAHLTDLVVGIANQTCGGKIVSFLEGGYDLEALGLCAVEHVRQLMA